MSFFTTFLATTTPTNNARANSSRATGLPAAKSFHGPQVSGDALSRMLAANTNVDFNAVRRNAKSANKPTTTPTAAPKIDPKYGRQKAAEIAKVFTPENIKRAAAGDPDALHRVNYFLNQSKSIKKFDQFISADVKKQIAIARKETQIDQRVAERDKSVNANHVYWSEVGKGLKDGFSTLGKGLVRIPGRLYGAVKNIVTNPVGATVGIIDGVKKGCVETWEDGKKNGLGSGALTGLSKLESTLFGIGDLARENSKLHQTRQDSEQSKRDAKNATEINERLKKAGVHRLSDQQKADAAERDAKNQENRYRNQYETTTNQAADSTFKSISSAFVIGKGFSQAVTKKAGTSVVMWGPVTIGGTSKIAAPFSSAINTAKNYSSTSLSNLGAKSLTFSDKLFNKAVIAASSAGKDTIKSNLYMKGALLAESTSKALVSGSAKVAGTSAVVSGSTLKTPAPVNFNAIKPTFVGIKDLFGKPAAICADKAAASGFLGKCFWKPAGLVAKVPAALGIVVAAPVAIGHTALATTFWAGKNLYLKPIVFATKALPATTYSAFVPPAAMSIPFNGATVASSPSNVDAEGQTPATDTNDAGDMSPNSTSVVSDKIKPVLQGNILLGSRKNSKNLIQSEEYRNAVEDAQLKLQSWAEKSDNQTAKELATKMSVGEYDDSTRALTKEFQKYHGLDADANLVSVDENDPQGLVVDGILGPRTSRALNFVYQQDVLLNKDQFKSVTKGYWQRNAGAKSADGNTVVTPPATNQNTDAKQESQPAPNSQASKMGIGLADVKSNDPREILKPSGGNQVIVSTVSPNSFAALAGIRPGMQITEVNGTVINNSTDLENLISQAGGVDIDNANIVLGTRKKIKLKLKSNPANMFEQAVEVEV